VPELRKYVPAECFVEFRPKADWKGNYYGFDWMREGDFDISVAPGIGDSSFKEIIGKHYVSPGVVQPDGNKYKGDFKPDTGLFKSLETFYERTDLVFNDGTTVTNYTAFVNVYMKEKETKTIELQVRSIVRKSPESLELRCDRSDIVGISPSNLSDLGVNYGGKPHMQTIKITLKDTLDNPADIKVVSVTVDKDGLPAENIVGKLTICPNNKSNRKKKAIVLISVKTPSFSGLWFGKRGDAAGNKDFIVQTLHQALIDPQFEEYASFFTYLDLSDDPGFKSYIKEDAHQRKAVVNWSGSTGLEKYCYAKFKEYLKDMDPALENKYNGNDYLKAFYFGENLIAYDRDGSVIYLNGYSTADHEFVVMSGTAIQSTAVHEFLHALGLPHTFHAKGDYCYRGLYTENVLDYTHHLGDEFNNARISLYKWQWTKSNGNAQPEP